MRVYLLMILFTVSTTSFGQIDFGIFNKIFGQNPYEEGKKDFYKSYLVGQGETYMAQRNYEAAYEKFLEAYDEYDSEDAAIHLGMMYELGIYVSINRDKAYRFYKWAVGMNYYPAKQVIERINSEGWFPATDEMRNRWIGIIAAKQNAGGGYNPNFSGGYNSDGGAGSSSSRTQCRSCHGTGKCTMCSGQGGYWLKDTGMYVGKNIDTYKTCSQCHGTGNCRGCGGSGSLNY